MRNGNQVRVAIRRALAASSLVALSSAAAVAYAQDELDMVIVTGTRITAPGAVSSSPIQTIGAQEIAFQQQPEVERILRALPSMMADDGANVNNGTAGAATINLRGLGPQRNLILLDGKRVIPYDTDGLVDTSMIPTALIERIDIVTGGASAVYGSDAISGALNFVMRKDFEGVEIDTTYSKTGESDGRIATTSLTLGSNVADGRGNVVLSLNYTDRQPVMLGSRPLGRLGIETASGAGYDDFLAGAGPTPAPAGCGGPGSVVSGGSGTTLPTRVAITGGGAIGQFRDDGTIGPNCSVFNFNPFNYYQTPQKRFGGTVIGNYEISEQADVYTRLTYSSTNVRQQVAASGIFGSAMWTPLANTYIGNQARQTFIDAYNAGIGTGIVYQAGGGALPNWRDLNGNGVVDIDDDILVTYSRRTVEFGERSTTYDSNIYQLLAGVRGELGSDWNYDVSFSYGESDRQNTSAGYVNVSNAANAIDAVPNALGQLTCRNGDPSCVPLNMWGGFGAITPDMAGYSSATAILTQAYSQTIASASVSGPVNAIHLPWADNALLVSVGAEYREERGSATPDECWKLAPASCLGGAGGNILPISGGYDVKEGFAEAILPIASGLPGLYSLDLELGYRYSDYSSTGSDDTYKYGFNWKPIPSLMFRAMQQRATRAPNIGELASPQTTALDNAVMDPCSIANVGNITPQLEALCISTGMTAAQVGVVQDIVVGQINTFSGTDLNNLPGAEKADTLTIGLVWNPTFGGSVKNTMISLDYYDIEINDYINNFAPQEVLDGCYVLGITDECSKIRRVGGGLTLDGSGVETFVTNLDWIHAEGVELGFNVGFDIGRFGGLTFAGTINKYLTHEYLSAATSPVVDCKGYYGTSCGGPLPDIRWVQRTTWNYNNFDVSLLWRHFGSVDRERPDLQAIIDGGDTPFEAFTSISSYDWFDLYASWTLADTVRLSAGVTNLFGKDPPVVGNEAADTSSNSGNTFPSAYDTLGRVYTIGVNFTF